MSKIALKDVLPYYFGQRFRCQIKGRTDYTAWMKWVPEALAEFQNDMPVIQLALRKLDSMTESDMDLGDFIPAYSIVKQVFTRGYCMEIDSIHDDGYCLTIYPDGSMYCICKDNGENYPYKGAALFHQLLSHGFDLFGLIESGQAVDAKTLNP